MTPLTDAVSFIYHETRQLATTVQVPQSGQELVAGTQLYLVCACVRGGGEGMERGGGDGETNK